MTDSPDSVPSFEEQADSIVAGIAGVKQRAEKAGVTITVRADLNVGLFDSGLLRTHPELKDVTFTRDERLLPGRNMLHVSTT